MTSKSQCIRRESTVFADIIMQQQMYICKIVHLLFGVW